MTYFLQQLSTVVNGTIEFNYTHFMATASLTPAEWPKEEEL